MIEKALSEAGEFGCAYLPQHFDSSRTLDNNSPTIWHLHGVIEDPATSQPQPESIVASLRDVLTKQHQFRMDSVKGEFLLRALRDRVLLVVGYSGTDDYDIVPFLLQMEIPFPVTWLVHLSDPSVATEPRTSGSSWEDDVWYAEESINLLASMADFVFRLPEDVRVLRCNTYHALNCLVIAGPEKTHPKPTRDIGSAESASAAEHPSWEQRMATWACQRFTVAAGKYHFAKELCLAAGLQKTQRTVEAAMRTYAMQIAEPVDKRAALSALLDAMIHNAPLQANWTVPHVADINLEAINTDMSEVLYRLAKKEVSRWPRSGDLADAKRCCIDALREADREGNPRIFAQTTLLVARIAQLEDADDASVFELYERALEAAYDSGSHEVLTQAYAGRGLYGWARINAGSPTGEVEFGRCVGSLAEALRLQLVEGDDTVSEDVAATLGLALDSLNGHRLRGLRAHGYCLLTSARNGHKEIQASAEERIRTIAPQVCPLAELAELHGEQLARALLARLDSIPEADILI
jgi:hypothetical protein